MQDLVKSIAREIAQKLVGVLALWLVAHGIEVPEAVTNWATLTLIAGALVVWTALVRALESAPAGTPLGKLAHLLARVLMLGIIARPTYPPQTPAVVQEMRARQVRP